MNSHSVSLSISVRQEVGLCLLPLLMAPFAVCAPLAGAFGGTLCNFRRPGSRLTGQLFLTGLLASGILKLDGIGKVHTWQQIFLIEGIITTAIGIGAYLLMTDRPEVAKWLSQEEKDLAASRIKAEHVGSTTVLDKMSGRAIKQGIFAPTTLVIGLIFLLDNITVQGVAFFTPTIVRTIYPKKSTITQQLFTVPPYIVGAFFTVLVSSPHPAVFAERILIPLPVVPLHFDEDQAKRRHHALQCTAYDGRLHYLPRHRECQSSIRSYLSDHGWCIQLRCSL